MHDSARHDDARHESGRLTSRLGPAVPILPTGDQSRMLAFFRRLGCDARRYDDGYAFVGRDDFELHYSTADEHDPWRTAGMAYVHVSNVDSLHAEFAATGLWRLESGDPPCTGPELHRRWDSGEGLARIGEPGDKPWGVREFTLMDPDNNLLRFGQRLAD